MKTLCPAWQFVTDHQLAIYKFSAKFCPNGKDLDDFRQDLILETHRRFPDYQPGKGSPMTWIYHLAWGLRSGTCKRTQREIRLRDRLRERPLPRSRSAVIAESRAQLSQVLAVAGPGHIEAMRTVIDGLTKDEVRARLGVSYQARNGRLRRLGARVERAA
jgi:RNA polymerase sigma factor (sigma-70 family)